MSVFLQADLGGKTYPCTTNTIAHKIALWAPRKKNQMISRGKNEPKSVRSNFPTTQEITWKDWPLVFKVQCSSILQPKIINPSFFPLMNELLLTKWTIVSMFPFTAICLMAVQSGTTPLRSIHQFTKKFMKCYP